MMSLCAISRSKSGCTPRMVVLLPSPTSFTLPLNLPAKPGAGSLVSELVESSPYSLCISKMSVDAVSALIKPAKIIRASHDLPEPVVPKIPALRLTKSFKFKQTG